MAERAMDGHYYAQGRAVFRAPLSSDSGITMGFCVCELAPGVDDSGAEEIARSLNRASPAGRRGHSIR